MIKNRYSNNADKVVNRSHSTVLSVSPRYITPNRLPPTIEIAAIGKMAHERVIPDVYKPSRHSVSRTPKEKARRNPYEKNVPANEPPAFVVVFRIAVCIPMFNTGTERISMIVRIFIFDSSPFYTVMSQYHCGGSRLHDSNHFLHPYHIENLTFFNTNPLETTAFFKSVHIVKVYAAGIE